jgi:riboflavin kinase/FMN adenylyltransferase
MQVFHDFNAPPEFWGGWISFGNFDGVHRGHQDMIAQLVKRAKSEEVPSILLTFNPPPLALLAPDKVPPRLMTFPDKCAHLSHLGVDALIEIPTTIAFLQQTPREFFNDIVIKHMRAIGMMEGENFCFGKARAGNIHTLEELCTEHGIHLEVFGSYHLQDELVSSTRIRQLINQGQVEQAADLMGRPYALQGLVIEGQQRGRTIGFPTANLGRIETIIPGSGVYAGVAHVHDKPYRAAIHIGENPTFDDAERKIEVHLLDFHGEIYGETMTVDFRHKIRDILKFHSAIELQFQIQNDVETARQKMS